MKTVPRGPLYRQVANRVPVATIYDDGVLNAKILEPSAYGVEDIKQAKVHEDGLVDLAVTQEPGNFFMGVRNYIAVPPKRLFNNIT